MNRAPQRDEIAATQTNLVEAASQFAGFADRQPTAPFRGEREEARSASVAGAAAFLSPEAKFSSDEIAPAHIEAPAPAQPAARLAPLIEQQALHLRHASRESLEVVLRPDGHTQLHLQLVQRDGHIEALVRCDQGDAQVLGGGWTKLQDSLAEQGIRLAPLADAARSGDFTGRQPGSSQQQHSSREPRWFQPEPAVPAPFFRPPTSTAITHSPPRTRPAQPVRRALESWA